MLVRYKKLAEDEVGSGCIKNISISISYVISFLNDAGIDCVLVTKNAC